MSQWYAIRAATRQETKAMRHLTEQGFSTFLPCLTLLRKLGGVQERVHRPLFPGYLFILCDGQDFPTILDVEGVHQFVRFGAGDDLKPYPFPASEIIKLQAQERKGEFDFTRDKNVAYRPRKGEMVRIRAGAWQSFVGQVIAAPSSKRARVKIEGPYGSTQTLDIAHLAAA